MDDDDDENCDDEDEAKPEGLQWVQSMVGQQHPFLFSAGPIYDSSG